MIDLSINEVVKATGGILYVASGAGNDPSRLDMPLTAVTFDSREAVDGSLFIALKGERSDGHDFVDKAKGTIAAAVVERKLDIPITQIVVDSTYSAVGAIGAYIRQKSGVTVVGITGSVGKTSNKELIAIVLSQEFNVLKTEGNFNNELGLPKTLFRLEPENEIAVLEMGISHFGEMKRLSAVARPDIAVFTNIENVHTEHLIDRDGVLRAKTELVENMRGDTLILNAEDDKLAGYKLPEGKRAVYYGIDAGDVTARDIVYHGLDSVEFTIVWGKCRKRVNVPAAGRHMVINSLAAAACGLSLGIGLDSIADGLEKYVPIKGRMRRLEVNGAVLLDDCYNASPTSMEASLKVFCAVEGRHIAVLGDMLELGERSSELHRNIGRIAAELGVDTLFAIGEQAKLIAEAAKENGLKNVFCVDKAAAAQDLKRTIGAGDTVLVKASRGMALEDVIAELTR